MRPRSQASGSSRSRTRRESARSRWPSTSGRQLRFPVGCRRALPIVTGTAGWTVEGGAVRLVGPDRSPILTFAPSPEDEMLRARSASGEAYTLERKEDLRLGRPLPPETAPEAGVPQATAVDPEKAPFIASVAGTYSVDRYTERDVCRIDLGRMPLAIAGRYQARVLEGCHDAGIAAFDPVAWRYEGGRLTITARRGHE